MAYQRQDHYYKKAKRENFASRAAYKLMEIDRHYRLFKDRSHVLDLGAAPGAWSQFVAQKIGDAGTILAIDLQKISITLSNLIALTGDIFDSDLPTQILKQYPYHFPADVVLSDMAPKTTGIKLTDQLRSLQLCERALEVATQTLKPGGHFVCKLFFSAQYRNFMQKLRDHFEKVHTVRPKSTRKTSSEVYFVCLGKKGK